MKQQHHIPLSTVLGTAAIYYMYYLHQIDTPYSYESTDLWLNFATYYFNFKVCHVIKEKLTILDKLQSLKKSSLRLVSTQTF